MNFELLLSITSVIIASISAIYTHSIATSEKNNVRHQNSQFNAVAVFDFISREYSDKKVDLNIPVDQEYLQKQKFENLKSVRTIALKKYNTDLESWKSKTKYNSESWESKVAHELSVTLNRLGLVVYKGGIPIDILLNLVSDQIIQDWMLCHYWVEKHREKQKHIIDSTPYHRKYAEWIAFLSAIWMFENYPRLPMLSDFIEKYGNENYIIKRFIRLSNNIDTLDNFTKKEICKISQKLKQF